MSLDLELNKEAKYGLVLYTDGGKDVSSEAAGWGVHGYLYPVLENKKEKFKKDKSAFGQYGYVNGQKTDKTFKPGDRLVQAGGLYKLFVNEPNSMPSEPVTPIYFFDYYGPQPGATVSEVEIEALEESLKIILGIPELSQAVIVADSEYVCKTVTEYIHSWVKNKWIRSNGKPVEHSARWKKILEQLTLIREKGIVLRMGWTRSHVGEPGNEAVDANATKGKIAVLNNLQGKRDVIETKNYGQKKKLNNRLLEQRWWYGINNELTTSYSDFAGKYVYFLGNHGKAEEEDDMIGKYTSTARIAILVTPEKEPVLEMLHDYLFERFYEEVGLVTLGYLEHITQTERYAQLAREGHAALYPKGRDNAIFAPDGVAILKELRPTFHGLRLLDSLKWHLGLLKRFVDEDASVVVTDITDIVYTREDNGKKVTVKPAECINPPHKTVSLEVGYSCMGNTGTKKVPFKMGQDLPLRNTLNAVADESVRVYAITWQRSRNEFRYATVVKVGEDLLLTCSLSSNLVTLVGLK